MANLVHSLAFTTTTTTFFLLLLMTLFNTSHSFDSLSFTLNNFSPNEKDLILQGDAQILSTNNALQLTSPNTHTVGRALYSTPVRLSELRTGRIATFDTNFTFVVNSLAAPDQVPADGLAFFIAPINTTIPSNSSGGYLGLFSPQTALNRSMNQVVAVEFDNFGNSWDPPSGDSHVALLHNSISASNLTGFERREGVTATVRITYTPPTTNRTGVLRVTASYPPNTQFTTRAIPLNVNIDLPEWVRIGFSAATGDFVQTHSILSWSFTSKLLNNNKKKVAKEDNNMHKHNIAGHGDNNI
ncbi:hypothetical protein RIF29_23388 [Crotalaria pallida]|uniref:Legume lectin domain-containing protein n=1 Tax=Crotalaria pallida TaxID=3830 RepID=A0AAN9F5J6_CROPI